MPRLKETFSQVYDRVMSKLGIDCFCIQWNHAYTPPRDDYKRHFHVVLSQTLLPISHAKIEFLPFPLRKFIVIDPEYSKRTYQELLKEYGEGVIKKYTMYIVP